MSTPTQDKALDCDRVAENIKNAAARAKAEADARRLKGEETRLQATEINGRDGPEPTRFGDWEQGGIAWDF